jgi:two-component system sensor histidine kinase RegB
MPSGDSASSIGPSRQNLLRLWLIRSILLVALITALVVFREFTDYSLPWASLWALLLIMALLNVALLYRLWLRRPVGEAEFFGNLLLDIAFLTGILYFSGGAANPLVSYYLIPLIVSAALLKNHYTWLLAGIAVACYTVLFFHYQPFALFAMAGHAGMSAHMTGMWINFAFSALLIAWFVARMAQAMRGQQAAAARIREKALRDEGIVGVAGIAAGAAHELRTPLATMTVLADELHDEWRDRDPKLAGDLELLQQQLQRCEAILGELVTSATHARERRESSLEELVNALVDTWRIARPEVNLQVSVEESAKPVCLAYNQGLAHALLNFLHNAADASPDDVALHAAREDDRALIVIEDRGEGIPGDIAEALGRRFVSRRDGGLGLGVLLGSATIERLDGEVTLLDREGGGTRWEVRLPLVRQPGIAVTNE